MTYGFGPMMDVFGWFMMALIVLPLWGLLITAIVALNRSTNRTGGPVTPSASRDLTSGGPR